MLAIGVAGTLPETLKVRAALGWLLLTSICCKGAGPAGGGAAAVPGAGASSKLTLALVPLVLLLASITRNCAAAATSIGSSKATWIPPATELALGLKLNSARPGLP